VVHVIAFFAFHAQSLLFCSFGKFVLQRIFLSTIAFFFPCVGSFTLCERSAFARFIDGYSMSCVSFTFWTVRVDFFGNVHFNYQLANKETNLFLYFMTFKQKRPALLSRTYCENQLNMALISSKPHSAVFCFL
jgi:hypothetical protein